MCSMKQCMVGSDHSLLYVGKVQFLAMMKWFGRPKCEAMPKIVMHFMILAKLGLHIVP